ncbi:MAG: acyltransferase family protein [Arthrobacter sp.]
MLGDRDYRIDHAKGLLIFLVVLGHILEVTSYWQPDAIRLPLTAIYLFHMPAFIFLAGATAKSDRLAQRVSALVVLLLFGQAMYWVGAQYMGGSPAFSYFPYWLLWFLLVMIYWQLLLPLVLRMRAYALGISVAVSAAAGWVGWIGNDFALSRALVFMPFYVAGALYGKRIIAYAGSIPGAAKAAVALGSVMLVGAVFALNLSPWWFFGNRSYEGLGSGLLHGVVVRLALLAVASVLTFTLLTQLSGRRSVISGAGKRSLGVFLMHGLVVMALTPAMPAVLASEGKLTAIALAAVIGLAVVSLFALPMFDMALRRISTAPYALLSGTRRADRGPGSSADDVKAPARST